MSRTLEKRVNELEIRAGGGGDLYVQRVRFSEGLMDDSAEFCEVRWLIANNGTPEERFVRELKAGELVKGAEGGEEPWIINPSYEPDPKVRERHKREEWARHGRAES